MAEPSQSSSILSAIPHCLLSELELLSYVHSTPPVMPWWKAGSDFRRLISFILARRQDWLLSWRLGDCSWGDKWRDLDWSPSWWPRSQLPLILGLEPRWILSSEMPWVISREAGDLLHTSTGVGSDSSGWSWVLDVTGSSSSTCYEKVKIQNQTHNDASEQKGGKENICPRSWKQWGSISANMWICDSKSTRSQESICV